MSDPLPGQSPRKLNRGRMFILIFFGAAALLIVTTIVGTLRNMDLEEEYLRQQKSGSAIEAPAEAAPPAATP